MRLWSIHPAHLDTKGLLAVWREGLLARKVLQGKTAGYRNHPQLNRFRNSGQPLPCIAAYLREIFNESLRRGYHFDGSKLGRDSSRPVRPMPVTAGQVRYEFELLKMKLRGRDRRKYGELRRVKRIKTNGLFKRIPGKIEPWEVVKPGIL
jgi:hypothetical protein